MHICVVGSGYGGLVTGTCFAEFGVDVTCVDNDAGKSEALERGKIPIYEPGLRPTGLLAAPRVVDCRNTYDPQRTRAAGFEYLCVGR